jgi:hypothetical protein
MSEFPQNESDEARSRHSGCALWMLSLLGLFVLYILFIGPAVWLHQRYPGIRRAVEILYSPMNSIYRANPGWQPAMDKYRDTVTGQRSSAQTNQANATTNTAGAKRSP